MLVWRHRAKSCPDAFEHLSEVRRVESLLAHIPTWFRVFRRWAILPEEKAPEGVGLTALWNTAFARWVLENRLTLHPLSRAELQALHVQLSPTTLGERWETFQTETAAHSGVTPQELSALGPLAACARDKLEEVLAIDMQTADLHFIEGLLVVE